MKAREKRKIRVGLKVLLKLLDHEASWMFIPSKTGTVKQLRWLSNHPFKFEKEFWREYYLSSIHDGVDKLLRKGHVEVRELDQGIEVKLTEKGKTQTLRYEIDSLKLGKPDNWDCKWRLVFFDIEELNRFRRDLFRRWLNKLGLKRMQRSVFVYPYPLENEIKFLREVLEIPHGVKLILAEKIENDEDLREWFDL